MTYYLKQRKDLDLEAESIDRIKDFLEEWKQVQLNRTSHYHKFDFVSADESVYFEIKSRRNTLSQYPTTMMPAKKIDYARTKILPTGGRAFFIFHFTDCLAYIEYSEEVFSSFEKKTGGRFDRGGAELNLYCYIPVSSLTVLPDYTVSTPLAASSGPREWGYLDSSDSRLPPRTFG